MRFLLSSVVLLALTSIAKGQGPCPKELAQNVPCYELKANSLYCHCFSFVQATWNEATAACRNNTVLPARLLSIEDSEEQQLLVTFLRETAGLSLVDYFWTSGTDSLVEGTWFWTSTGDLLSYTNWIGGFENDNSKDCMVLNQGQGYQWEHAFCESKHQYICELSLAPAK